jgi:hypothetical protein
VTNTLAYYVTELIIAVKSFIKKASWKCIIVKEREREREREREKAFAYEPSLAAKQTLYTPQGSVL